MARSKTINMTSGPLMKNIIIFALPIIGINVLQVFFHATDVAVLGIFSSDNAVAAVGANTALINLFVNFFVGLATATNILVARAIGSKNYDKANKFVGTSIFISIIFGFILMAIVLIFGKQCLIWMKCPEVLLDMATTYLRVYFIGIPIVLLYNFSAAIMRAIGDTFRPFIYLIIGGVLNVVLNVFFVVVLKIDVAGVAIATVVSNGITAILSLRVLVKGVGEVKLEKKYLKWQGKEIKDILVQGVPSGIGASMFALSNVILKATFNSFGEVIMAADTLAHQIDQVVSNVMTGFTTGALSFISQNLGAKKYKRVWKVLGIALTCAVLLGLIVGVLIYVCSRFILGFMTSSSEVIEYAVFRLKYMCLPHFVTGAMNIMGNLIRAIKKPFTCLFINIFCCVVLRIAWIYTIFPLNPILGNFYLVYPITWGLCGIVYACVGIPMLINAQKRHEKEEKQKIEKQKNLKSFTG